MINKDSMDTLGQLTDLVAGTAHKHVGLVIEQSNKDVEKLMSVFQSLLSKLQEDKDGPSVTKEITAILEALQYHDRTTQILDSIQKSLSIYINAVDQIREGKDVDMGKIDEDLRSHFVVAEQYAESDENDQHVNSDKPLFF